MIILILLIFLFIFITIKYNIPIKNTTIFLHINMNNIKNEIKNNESKFYEFICENINLINFKEQFLKIIKQYDLIISNKIIFDNSLNIPNGQIFKYIFNQESCKMLLYEGIFCEIIVENKKIPLHILLKNNSNM